MSTLILLHSYLIAVVLRLSIANLLRCKLISVICFLFRLLRANNIRMFNFRHNKCSLYFFFYIDYNYPMIPARALPSSIDQQQSQMSPKIKFSLWHTFKHHIPRFLVTILIDIILPLVIYFALQKHIKPVYALLAASSPPLLMVIFKAAWFCTFDALGFLVFFTFALSAIVAITTRNPIILLLEKSLVTGLISIIFGITLIPFHCCHHRCRLRPLAYYFYQDLVPTKCAQVGLPESLFTDQQESITGQYVQLKEEISLPNKQEVAQVYEWIYTNCSSFRLSCYLITTIWSIGLMLEFLARLVLILMHLSINKILIYGHLILSSITVICIVSTIICITTERKHTLVFIERWNEERQQKRLSEMSTFVVTGKDHSNVALTVDT
jgi:hypothetical protein